MSKMTRERRDVQWADVFPLSLKLTSREFEELQPAALSPATAQKHYFPTLQPQPTTSTQPLTFCNFPFSDFSLPVHSGYPFSSFCQAMSAHSNHCVCFEANDSMKDDGLLKAVHFDALLESLFRPPLPQY